MSSTSLTRRGVIVAGAAVMAAGGTRAARPGLTKVAEFEQQVTGVAVSRDGRLFVNFPRWEKDVAVSVAEVMKDGRLRPYPDAGWNAWSNLKPLSAQDHFVCVQSVTVDPQWFLWVVDLAALGNEFIRPGGVKPVKIDLANAVGMRAPDGTTRVVAQDARLRWPDSLAEGADGSIYVTASHIQDMAQFHEKGSMQRGKWGLFRIAMPHGR